MVSLYRVKELEDEGVVFQGIGVRNVVTYGVAGVEKRVVRFLQYVAIGEKDSVIDFDEGEASHGLNRVTLPGMRHETNVLHLIKTQVRKDFGHNLRSS